MSITINRVTCNKWGQELAALHEDTRSVCDFLNSAVLQTRREFGAGRDYNGGYIHPAPVKQGAFYLYPIEVGSFTLTTHPLEQHSLAVMEEVLTKEMLTSYLYEVCAVVVEAAAKVYIDHVMRGATTPHHRMLSRKDAMVLMTNYHIAALREDMQRAMSFKDKAESLMHHVQHEKSKLFGQWGYSEGLLKRARHEINKRGAKVNRLRKEVKELVGAVQHLAKDNVRLTDDCSRLQRSIMGGDGLNECGAPLYPPMSEQHEREKAECRIPDEALRRAFIANREYLKKTDCSLSMYQLKERYKGLRGCGANDKRYQFRKSFQAVSKFSQYVCKEYDVMQSAQCRQLHTYDLTLPIGKYGVSAPENTPQHVIDVGRTLMANLGRTAGIIDCDVEIHALHKSGFYLLRAWVRTARNQKHTDSRCVNTENLSDAHRICAELLADIMSYLFGQPTT